MADAPRPFLRFANAVADASGKPAAFIAALALILAWLLSGPVFHYDETWQLVVNTATTIITFLMVFVLQNAQNRDGRAIQAKLDQLILSSNADNRYVGVEHLDEAELRRLSERLVELAGTRPDESPLDEVIVEMVTDEKAKNMAEAVR